MKSHQVHHVKHLALEIMPGLQFGVEPNTFIS